MWVERRGPTFAVAARGFLVLDLRTMSAVEIEILDRDVAKLGTAPDRPEDVVLTSLGSSPTSPALLRLRRVRLCLRRWLAVKPALIVHSSPS
jgi:hypothetical protein